MAKAGLAMLARVYMRLRAFGKVTGNAPLLFQDASLDFPVASVFGKPRAAEGKYHDSSQKLSEREAKPSSISFPMENENTRGSDRDTKERCEIGCKEAPGNKAAGNVSEVRAVICRLKRPRPSAVVYIDKAKSRPRELVRFENRRFPVH